MSRKETKSQREKRLSYKRRKYQERIAKETPEHKRARLDKNNANQKLRLMKESKEHRDLRLKKMRLNRAASYRSKAKASSKSKKQHKYSQEKSTIQDMPVTKTSSIQRKKKSEPFFNEAVDFDNCSSDPVAKSATKYRNNSTPNNMNHVNIQINDESTKTDLPVSLSNIKKEVDVNDEDVAFSSESCDILEGERLSIKMDFDSQSSFYSEDEILPENLLQVFGQENSSTLNKNYETDSSIIPSNVSDTTNYCAEYHAEKNDKNLFVKLELQGVSSMEYAKACLLETDLELKHHKTGVHAREPKRPKTPMINYKFLALNTSPKWKGRIIDYSRTNKDISNEKLVVNKSINRNLYSLSHNSLISTDICGENQMFLKTSKILKKKDELKNTCIKKINLKNKRVYSKIYCQPLLKKNAPLPQTSINLDDESFKTRHIFEPDFGKIK